jgi:hypothetical protein
MRLCVCLMLLVLAGPVMAADAPVLTETQRLRAQVAQLKTALLTAQYELATCQAQASAATITRERAAIEAELRLALKASATAVLDWDTLTFNEPSPPQADTIKK